MPGSALTQEELGRRIARARSRRDISQGELAESVGLSQSAISRIESGERAVDSLELAAIAKRVGVSVLDLLEEIPDEFMSLAARAQETLAPADLDRARGRLFELLRFSQLLDHLGVPPLRGSRAQVKLPPRSGLAVDQGRKLANRVREDLGLKGPLSDLLEIVEEAGLDIALEPMPEGPDGICVQIDDSAIAIVNSAPVYGRQRFTVAHEFCHFLLEDAQPILIDKNLFPSRGRNREQEMRANAFAAHFLMPVEGIEWYLEDQAIDEESLAGMQNYFGVSLQSLLWHLTNLKMISPKQRAAFEQLRPKTLAMMHGYLDQWIAGENQRDSVRLPSRLHRRALKAYAEGRIGTERLAELLGRDDVEGLRRELDDLGITGEGGWLEDTAPA